MAALAAQSPCQNQVATHEMWALDFSTNQIRVFSGSGEPTAAFITLAGSGSARGFGFNDAGLAYVARGQEVRTYDGTTTTLFAGTAAGIDQAQHVAVRPGPAQEVWVACGTTTSNSKIIKFNAAGTVLQTYTNSLMNHPRRLAWNQDGTVLYVASNANQKILTLDPSSNAIAQLADLTAANIAPIGVCFDRTRNAVWTVGDFGGNGNIGFVDTTLGLYTNVISEGQFPGLTSAANVFFDRFRTLTIAARNLNNGTGCLYRFSAQTGTAVSNLGSITAGITSLIDCAARPEIIGIGAPVQGSGFVIHTSLSSHVVNNFTFNCPRAANLPYAAALSPRWQQQCSPYIPGIIDPGLRLGPPDARGIPLSLADGGFLIMNTAAICCYPATPAAIAPYFTINGFAGTLSPTGTATAMLDFAPANPVIAGIELSLVFITVDTTAFDLFGRISDPICLTILVGP